MNEKLKESLIRSLMAQREKINKKLTTWNNQNMNNMQLENQLIGIDGRIDQLLLMKDE